MNRKKLMRRLRLGWQAFRYGEVAFQRSSPPPALCEDDLAQVRQFFPRPKFFILGHARSGTTLLLRLVRLHPEVHANYQAHFFTRPPGLLKLVRSADVVDWLTHRANRWNGGEDPSALLLRVVADFLMEREAAAAGKAIVGDKSPTSVWHGKAVRDMHCIYPDARLIYIVRDGRDVVLSERFRDLVEEKNLTAEDRKILRSLERDATPFLRGERSIFTPTFLQRLGSRWAVDVREVDETARRLYGERYFVLRYEDLLVDPVHWMRQIWEFLGVESLPADLADRVNAEMQANPDKIWQQQRNPGLAGVLKRGRQGNWRQFYTRPDRRLFARIAGNELIHWGYESDDRWVKGERSV